MIATKEKLVIKKHVRLLAEKFLYSTDYVAEVIVLHKEPVTIKINISGSNQLEIWHTINSNISKHVIIESEACYDYIVKAFLSPDKAGIVSNAGDIISMEIWTDTEQISLKEISQTIAEIRAQGLERYLFRGNRILAEYYKGIILVRDDLGYYKTNVLIY